MSTSTNNPATVLITGANGHIGYGVLLGALQAGHHVRAVVRRPAAEQTIRAAPSAAPYLSTGALSIITVPDQIAPGAFTTAMQGCTYVVHMAAPLPGKGGSRGIVTETVDGIRRLLEAAEQTLTVRRVVIASSSYAVLDYRTVLDGTPTPAANADTRLPVEEIEADPRVASVPGLEYNLAKVRAKLYTEEYMAQNRPEAAHFGIVNILPGFVFGGCDALTTKEAAAGSSNFLLAHMWMDLSPMSAAFYGVARKAPVPVWATHTHLGDLVDAFLNAFDAEKVPGRLRNFLVVDHRPAGGSPYDASTDVVKRELPEIAEAIKFVPCSIESKHVHLDCGSTETELLGRELKTFRQQVLDTLPWLLSLPDN